MTDNVDEVVETVVEPVVTTEETTPPPEDTAKTGDEEAKPEVKPEKTFTQAELDDILQRRLAKEQRKIERYARAEAERDQLREQLDRQTQTQQPSVQSGEPKPEQFKTYEEYIKATAKWEVKQENEQARKQYEQEAQTQAQQIHEAKIRDNLSKVANKYDDFEEVVTNPSLAITPVMTDAMGESEIGGEIAYYLGNHPKEAAEIARLSNVAQVKAIDRLEAKLAAPPKVSEAPPPAQVVGKGKATQQVSLESASLDDYMKVRQKQGARWANR
jgi:hypothetical protein